LVSGEHVALGTAPWTASGLLLCAVSGRGDRVHVHLVDTATGESTEQGEPWEDVCWLSLVGRRVLVGGKSGGVWVVADVTGGGRMVLTASFARIVDVAATPERLWVVAAVESGGMGLWSMDLLGEHLRLHVVAPSIHGMQMRLDGRTVAVMAGPAGAETVRVTTIDDEEVLDIGRSDMIMGWIEEQMPHGRLPHLHYLLTPTFRAVDVPMTPSAPRDAETGTLAMADAPAALTLAGPIVPEEEAEHNGAEPDETALVDSQSVTPAVPQPDQRPGGRERLLRRVAVIAVVVIIMVIVATALVVRNGRRAGVATDGTLTVSTPSTPSVILSGDDVAVTPSAETVTPGVPPGTSPVVVKPAPTTPPAIVTYGVKTGLWVAPTEQLRVRQGAGTGSAILGYLLAAERARVLSGPTIVGTAPWWYVRCYGTDGKARLTGWVSGEYVRPSSAPVVSPAAQPAIPAKPVPVVKPTTGTIILVSVPAGARVVVNGTDRGVTPLSMALPAKEVFIAVSLPGYLDYTTSLTVEAGTTVRLTYPLLSLGSTGN